jgi:hypothetical protein
MLKQKRCVSAKSQSYSIVGGNQSELFYHSLESPADRSKSMP